MLAKYASPHVAVIRGNHEEEEGTAVMHYQTCEDGLDDVAYMVEQGHKLLGFYPVPMSLH
ncbi:MAG: hypothetical protein [Bacteriophage sp.]|nr:MAG: hypothetical protein [Bacteriophage sp.]